MMNPRFKPLFQLYTFNNGATIKNRLTVAPSPFMTLAKTENSPTMHANFGTTVFRALGYL